jgi:hypothetical protein
MGKSSASPPDYNAITQSQLAVNKAQTQQNQAANLISQVGPTGSTGYTLTGYTADGMPQYTQVNTLNPLLQQNYDLQLWNQNRNQNLMTELVNPMQANFVGGINTNAMTPTKGGLSDAQQIWFDQNLKENAGDAQLASSPLAIQGQVNSGDLQHAFDQQQQAAYNSQMAYLRPQQQQQTQQQIDQLAQQGITQASNPTAYANAMSLLNNNQTFANQQAYNNSYQSGLAGANQLYNQNLQNANFANAAQAQSFGQSATNAGAQNAQNQFNANLQNSATAQMVQNYLQSGALSNQASAQDYSNAINTYNAPLNAYQILSGINQPNVGGSVNTPTTAGQSAPNLMQAAQNNYQAQLASYNNTQSGLFGLGSAGIMAYALSDRRIKKDITKIGTRADGIGVYSFRYEWEDGTPLHVGVMAQEVAPIYPHAVATLPGGVMAVNYAAL